MVQRVSGFDASRRLADHHREFALVVHESGVGWAPGVAAVAIPAAPSAIAGAATAAAMSLSERGMYVLGEWGRGGSVLNPSATWLCLK